MNMAVFLSSFLIGYLFCLLAGIASSVTLAFAVFYDAKSKYNQNALMWGLLTGFLGFIPGIIYLCLRNEPLNQVFGCPNCGWGNPLRAPQCGHCGAPLGYPNAESAEFSRKAKNMLIWAIVLFAVSILAIIIMVVAMFTSVIPYAARW